VLFAVFFYSISGDERGKVTYKPRPAPKDIPTIGCKFIFGDSANAFHIGEAIYCGRPVARPGESSCETHRKIVFTPDRASRGEATN
jgi:hypothetical protein